MAESARALTRQFGGVLAVSVVLGVVVVVFEGLVYGATVGVVVFAVLSLFALLYNA